MTGKQENKYSMFLAVQTVCNANSGIWSGVPAFVTAFGEFEAGITNIHTTRLEQEKDLKGIAEDKLVKEGEMIKHTLGLIGPMVAYANVTSNEPLRQEVDYSKRELEKSRDTVLEDRCQIVQDRANTHSVELIASYGVTAGQITDHATTITDYHGAIAGPRSATAVKKTQTEALEVLLKSTMEILTGKLDQLIVIFETSNPQFVSDYKNARIIVDLGARQYTWTGTVGAGMIENIMDAAGNDATVWELTNEGTDALLFGRGADSSDMGTPVTVGAGETVTKTAIELGASGNKYLNVQNESGTEGSYKVVRD